ncbi:lytic polysaccharide monooxygenase auxiliary activity family 9 protein [Actinacidiphila oryziradicis]|uniref:Chitin-binding protein n=1 Tax=Actinacidiphila oryziradicis TaxID=2571141 RepID=A0A4U0SM13_9ACTN|nr:lytic polysaccharide monooxygenase [Actinacidiphila oryziradicis]TKA09267.1 chitin-binding protein [Actinacidiphila oryziradicis]
MTSLRKALGAALALTWLTAGPAAAHGAPTDPVSRVVACSQGFGQFTGTAVCRAAVAANDNRQFTDWDNLRVAGVAGRDRQMIPDGKLCSGGLDTFKGLDLARTDWPATALTPGAAFTLTYRSTIAHEGTFKVYLTKRDYDPSQPLTWSDLPEKPFLTVVNPKLTNGAYHLTGRLPSDRTGRQLIYTIWQNFVQDTYYSCSDVVFPTRTPTAAAQRTAPAAATPLPATAAPATTSAPASLTPAPSSAVPGTPTPSAADASGSPLQPQPVAAESNSSSAPVLAVGGVVLIAAAVTIAAIAWRRRLG